MRNTALVTGADTARHQTRFQPRGKPAADQTRILPLTRSRTPPHPLRPVPYPSLPAGFCCGLIGHCPSSFGASVPCDSLPIGFALGRYVAGSCVRQHGREIAAAAKDAATEAPQGSEASTKYATKEVVWSEASTKCASTKCTTIGPIALQFLK